MDETLHFESVPSLGLLEKVWQANIFNTARAYYFLVSRFKKQVFGILVHSVFTGFFQMSGLLLLSPLLQMATGRTATGVLGRLFGQLAQSTDQKTAIFLWLSGFLVFGTTVILFKSFSEVSLSRFQMELENFLRNAITDSLFVLKWERFLGLKLGAVTKVIIADGRNFAVGAHYFIKAISCAIIASFMLVGAVLLMPLASLAMGIFGVVGYLVYRVLGLNRRHHSREMASVSKKFSEESGEVFGNLKYIVSTGGDLIAKARMKSSYDQYRVKYLALLKNHLRVIAVSESIMIGFVSFCLGYSLWGKANNLGIHIVVLALIYRSSPYLISAQRNYLTAKEQQVNAESWLALYRAISPYADVRTGTEIPTLEKSIVMNGVSYSYPSDKTEHKALEGVSWSLQRGECLVVLGESGSGKSTLIDLVTGLLEPSEGQVLVDGVSLSQINRRLWRTQIGFVPQSAPIFSGTVLENVTLGYLEPDLERARVCAEQASLLSFIESSPKGWNTETGEGGKMLSGGQCQRIAIARALYRNPKLLILDEATSALDAQNEKAIGEMIQALKGKRTLLVVTHRLTTASHADKILLLKNGRVEFIGTPHELSYRS